MKKIAFILALVMCFCTLLVACEETGNESDVADNSSAAVENSVATDDSAPVADDESEEPVADESEEVVDGPVEAGSENIALGKPYTTSTLFRQGGADAGWGWDENANVAYPDEEGVTLTDGVVNPAEDSYQDAAWVGFNANVPDYSDTGYAWTTIDLGEAKDIALVKVGVATAMFADVGIAAPSTVEVALSSDGENWSDAIIVVPTNPSDVACELVEVAVSGNAQFVQVRTTGAGWMFVSEIEVYGAK